MSGWWKNWSQRWMAGGRRPIRLLVGAGVLGILLIAVSEWLPASAGKGGEDSPTQTVTAAQVEAALEERITALLTEVEGVGSCRVMVTLEQEEQVVYAADTTVDSTGSYTEQQILYVATQEGPVGLPLTNLLPTVKGVAVVCAGGGDPAVCQRVMQVVTTAFHISERRVCVVPQQ